MDGEDEGGPRLSKRFSDKGGEVDFKTKAGTAWSHSYLNQKPWHPLSYPNQRRKWIAEQTHAQHQRRAEEIAREYAQEQEFFRQTALISKKEKEKVEMMQAVGFMYVRPPGYNAESAKAAEVADERKKEELNNPSQDGASSAMPPDSATGRDRAAEDKKKPRPKDVFGRPLPSEEDFEVLKNAPRLDTGVAGRAKPFGVEIRNVRCVRCGNYGHQSGDRECPLKDVITPNEEIRLKRDDPLTAILAHTDPSEPLKWELKQKPGMSPPRGGFDPNDPNQQIVAEDIFDEYGGFLSGGNIPGLLTSFTTSKKEKKYTKKSKHKRKSSPSGRDSKAYHGDGASDTDGDEKKSKRKKKMKNKQGNHLSSESDCSGHSDLRRLHRISKHKHLPKSSDDSDSDSHHRIKKRRQKPTYSSASDDSYSSERCKHKRSERNYNSSSSLDDSESHRYHRSRRRRHKHYNSSKDSDSDRYQRSEKRRKKHYYSSEDSDPSRRRRNEKRKHRHS